MRPVLFSLALAACAPQGQIDPYADVDLVAPGAEAPISAPSVDAPADVPNDAPSDAPGAPAIADASLVNPDADLLAFRATETMAGIGRAAMISGGGVAYMGMFSNVCEVNTNVGGTGTEFSVDPSEPEEVCDHDDDSVLSFTQNGWFRLTPSTREVEAGGRPGVTDARLDGDRVVALYDTPEGCVVDFDDATSRRIDGAACPEHDGWTVDTHAHEVWLFAGGDLWRVTPHLAQPYAVSGDLVTVDPATGTLYTASYNGLRLTARDADANVTWEAPTTTPIRQLTAMPARGGVAMLADTAQGSAIYYFSVDGVRRRALDSGVRLDFFSVAADGRHFAVARGTLTDFFQDNTP